MRAALIMTLAFTASAAAADKFPPADQLPSRPELPDPLVTLAGERMATPEQWARVREPELKELFQHYMYGYFPPPQPVTATVEQPDAPCLGGKATKREMKLSVGPPETPPIHLLLVLPAKRTGPVPAFLGLNFYGNHTVLQDPTIALPTAWVPDRAPGAARNTATDAGRGAQADGWAIEQTIDRGYAVAVFYCGDVEPDRANADTGIRKAWLKPAQSGFGPHDWGTIAAWAYGVHRCVDYLVTDPAIDKARIAVVGHSRLGKTTLLAAAFDERIALAIPLQAGCGGTAPSRSKSDKAESVTRINTSFPHWFTGAFKHFNDRPDRLPFDQHCLVALCAPRPVFFPNATEDQWANPDGQFDVLKAAEPVYKLLGAGGLQAATRPVENALSAGTLGYFIRPGRHAMTKADWKAFLDYTDQHFKR